MTNPNDANKVPDNQPMDKEVNFRLQEQRFQRIIAEKDRILAEKEEALRQAKEAQSNRNSKDDDDYSEPYVDDRRLNNKLEKFGKQTKQETQAEIKQAVQQAIYEERQSRWIKENPDFYQVLDKHAEQFALRNPELAEIILNMDDTPERQKLVYKNIKAMGLDKPEEKKSTIQDKIDSNKRGVFYQPSGMSTSPYSVASDFSEAGKKDAYEKMKSMMRRP